jgi:3,4-dihydroxy 2-butanone 4-phosphate synthase / GTP cyclohydrolase II
MSSAPAGTVRLDPVEQAVADMRLGRPVVVVDDEDRENEGDLILPASRATPELVAFIIRHTSGFVCVAMEGAELDRLGLPPMTMVNQDRKGTAYAVTVDARHGVATGISARDRARTIRVLADSATEPYELSRPGHVVPLRAVEGGVLQRPGHTEAAVDLARLAGLRPAGVLAELVDDDGSMMRAPRCRGFADAHGLTMISIADLIAHRRRTETLVERVVEARIPLRHGGFRAVGFRARLDGTEHVALVLGDVEEVADAGPPRARPPAEEGVLVRVHSECLTGDVLGSLRCDCGPQLDAALAAVAAEGRGVVVYMRGHEGRGIGLMHKLAAYALQDAGRDTVEANLDLGFPADAREYGIAAQMLLDLGVRRVRVLTNNPAKLAGLEGYGLRILGRAAMATLPTPYNLRYLRTKRDRMGHVIDLPDSDVPAELAIGELEMVEGNPT